MIRSIIRKSIRSLGRDKVLLLITLLCAPFFIFLYKLIFLDGMTIYKVLLYSGNSDAINTETIESYAEYLEEIKYPGGGDLFVIETIQDREEGLRAIRDHEARLMAEFDLSEKDAEIFLTGDFSDPYYVLASRLFRDIMNDLAEDLLEYEPPFKVSGRSIGISHLKTEFENYVPGIIIFSVLVQIFLFSMLITREIESNAFLRYRMAGVRGYQYIIARTIVFLLVILGACLLALISAFLFGFKSPVSVIYDLFMSLFVCMLLGFSVIGSVFVIVSFSESVIRAFLLSVIPFMVSVFFSGSVYPFPKIGIGQLGERTIGLFDFLPATHAVTGLHKILTFGINPGGLLYESMALIFLSLLTYLGGILVFSRKHLKL